jgi:hypothetical protein
MSDRPLHATRCEEEAFRSRWSTRSDENSACREVLPKVLRAFARMSLMEVDMNICAHRKQARRHVTMGRLFGIAALLGTASCGTDHRTVTATSVGSAPGTNAPLRAFGKATSASPAVLARVQDLRSRFLEPKAVGVTPHEQHAAGQRVLMVPALGVAAATGFELKGGSLYALLPPQATNGVARRATVTLPQHAGGPVRLTDDKSTLAVSFALRGVTDTLATTAGGIAVYAAALDGADVVYRVHPEGTEDYVVFERRPSREELVYDVDVSKASGIRLVANTLEFLDDTGTPRIRVAPPHAVGTNGNHLAGALAIDGCAFDSSPKAPWGRPVTLPGATHCAVRVSWHADAYPLMVDPSWTSTGSLVTARAYQTASLLNSGQILISGGFDESSNPLATAELYDPGTATFAVTSSMATARNWHTATVLGSGLVLIAGGSDNGADSLSTVELYNPTSGAFVPTGSMTTPRVNHASTLLTSGLVLVAGGYDNSGNDLSTAELFDPNVGAFQVTGSMGSARSLHTVTLLSSGQVLAAGGYDNSNNALATAETYNPTAGTFVASGAMTTEHAIHSAILLGSGSVLVVGGYDNEGDALSVAELYDPAAATFAATGSLSDARASFTAILLGTGKVLVSGGDDSVGNALASAEIYDPIAAAFSGTASLTTGRASHTATPLGSGDVLVAGGYGAAGILSSAEIYGCGSTNVALGSDQPGNTAPPGTTVTWTATASSCDIGAPTYQFWLHDPSGSWTSVQNSTSPTWVWSTATSTTPGNYDLQVWIKNSDSSNEYDAYAGASFALSAVTNCSSVTASTTPSGHTSVGDAVTIASSASCGSSTPEFQIWMKPPGGPYALLQDYGTSTAYNWDTSSAAPGSYSFQVWARAVGSPSPYDSYTGFSYSLATPCSDVTMTFSPPGSSVAGSLVTISAAPNCGGTPTYQFYVLPPGGSWAVAQAWSASATYSWDTTGASTGDYAFQVWVKNDGSSAAYEAYAGVPYTLTSGNPCTAAMLSSSVPSPQLAGTAVTLTGSASTCSNAEYEFWELDPVGAWVLAQSWSPASSFVWTGTQTGMYSFQVWIREAGSTGSYETYNGMSYQLN